MVCDGSGGVRTQLLRLLDALPGSDVEPHTHDVLLWIQASMTHIVADIRSTGLDFLTWLLAAAGNETVSCRGGWVKTLHCFMSVLAWKGGDEKEYGTMALLITCTEANTAVCQVVKHRWLVFYAAVEGHRRREAHGKDVDGTGCVRQDGPHAVGPRSGEGSPRTRGPEGLPVPPLPRLHAAEEVKPVRLPEPLRPAARRGRRELRRLRPAQGGIRAQVPCPGHRGPELGAQGAGRGGQGGQGAGEGAARGAGGRDGARVNSNSVFSFLLRCFTCH
ncbi:MAG: hypothetical protein INR71_11470 [Terriglobus roseus]|nr:hypothetical protein [Terriglobus roseus]